MAKNTNKNRFNDDDVFRKVDNAFDCLEKERTNGLVKLQALQNVKTTSLEKERTRLADKYGSDNPRIEKIDTVLVYNTGLQEDLNLEIDRSNIKPPDFDRDTWMLHGRVLDKDDKGIKGLTVSLFGENKKWIKELGFACTDKRGYFSISVSGKEKPDIPEDQKLTLTVTDENQQILHQETEPLFIKIGQIDYREIRLGDKDKKVKTPPPQTSVTFKLPKEKFCKQTKDENKYKFEINPPGGEVKGPGVIQDNSGDYFFHPSSPEVQPGQVQFEYHLESSVHELEVTVTEVKAKITNDKPKVDYDKNRALVKFHAKPNKAKTYEWNFFDKKTGTGRHPEHEFDISKEVSFDVNLIVTSQEGCIGTSKQTIDFCTGRFKATILHVDREDKNLANVQFKSIMKGDKYKWIFDDKDPRNQKSDKQSPTWDFDLKKKLTYQVSLEVLKGKKKKCKGEARARLDFAKLKEGDVVDSETGQEPT